ncbi:unnamed protein product [Microthlaspi erraticum]|jgi:hypothetical protein|uniref:Uncharacterized protein n=1 Tax=Microthlaspi erraticum TaxID=1685480 RepID=A0A6D2IUL6_9BRAS|nr:unnamed protein product [Microthlaspi erraticum]
MRRRKNVLAVSRLHLTNQSNVDILAVVAGVVSRNHGLANNNLERNLLLLSRLLEILHLPRVFQNLRFIGIRF